MENSYINYKDDKYLKPGDYIRTNDGSIYILNDIELSKDSYKFKFDEDINISMEDISDSSMDIEDLVRIGDFIDIDIWDKIDKKWYNFIWYIDNETVFHNVQGYLRDTDLGHLNRILTKEQYDKYSFKI